MSDDAINDNPQLPAVFCMQVVDSDPSSLFAMPIAPHGWAFALELDRCPREQLVERVGVASEEQMRAADEALRAALHL